MYFHVWKLKRSPPLQPGGSFGSDSLSPLGWAGRGCAWAVYELGALLSLCRAALGMHGRRIYPWPQSCVWAGQQPRNRMDLRTVGPHSFVLGLCMTYGNCLWIKPHDEVLMSVQSFTLWNKFHSAEWVCASLASYIAWLLRFWCSCRRSKIRVVFLWSCGFCYFLLPSQFLWVYVFHAAIPKCATETWTLHQKVSVVCLYF